jgi:hypothetical protein
MSGCLPIWTSDNSGIFPLWIGDDVTPEFGSLAACFTFSTTDENISFSGEVRSIEFAQENVNAKFVNVCL